MGGKFSSLSNEKAIEDNANNLPQLPLEIYIFGEYNPIMEIIIGQKKEQKISHHQDALDYDKEEKILLNSISNKENVNTINISNENKEENGGSGKVKQTVNEFLESFQNHKKEILSDEYNIKNEVFKWNLNFFCQNGLSFEAIENMRDKIKIEFEEDNDKNNIFILFIDSIESIYKVIDIFNSIHNEYHPLFLFIMQNEINDNITLEINDYILKNNIKYYNSRNYSFLQEENFLEFSEKDDDKNILNKKNLYILKIYSFLINAWFYYNNIGDDFDLQNFLGENSTEYFDKIYKDKNEIKFNQNLGLFNIIILGRPGVGKSTLVNILSNEKRSLEGRGVSLTKKIIKYIIKGYNISLYDTPGFESDLDTLKVKNLLLDLSNHLLKAKERIHIAFYLIQANGGRDFYDKEREILKVLVEKNIPIFFLLTFSDPDTGNEFKEVVEMSLRKTLTKIVPENGMNFYKNHTKVFCVHLLDEKNGSCKNFGIKNVMEELYNRFSNNILKENEISEIDKIIQKYTENKELKELSKFYELFKGKELYKHIEEIIKTLDNGSKLSVKDSKLYGILSYFIPSFFFNYFKKSLFKAIAKNFCIEINDKEIKGFIEKEEIVSLDIQKLSNECITLFSDKLKNAGINNITESYIRCFNNTIKGFKEIGKRFN